MRRTHLDRRKFLLTSALVTLPGLTAAQPAPTLDAAIEQAHARLWRERIDTHGVILDYIGELPTPEDCRLGRPNAIGWWSPIENGPMFTGLYLPAACERARRTGQAVDRSNARRLVQGLLKCASVSDVPGFIARGMGTDGQCHYPLTSDDQTHPWFYGLSAYLRSDIPTADERAAIIRKMSEVAGALQQYGWRPPCAGQFKGEFRGGFKGHLFRDAVRYLYMLRTMHAVTGDPVWLERYRTALAERAEQSDKTRIELCEAGYPYDRSAIANIDSTQLWIYIGCQASLAGLAAMESDPKLVASYRKGLDVNAAGALAAIEAYRQFDNNDNKVFGHADWRAVYGAAWFPQETQVDAHKLSEMADVAKAGERKTYERIYMRNPLAGATLIALAGHPEARETVARVVRHYDYSKLNMSELLFAETAYYAL